MSLQDSGRKPFFSIVMPMYNAETYVARSIESVLAQTASEWELLIVDDHSSDCSPDIIARYASLDRRIRILRNPQNLNISRSLNRGISEAAGEWIVRLDADDFFQPDYLSVLGARISELKKKDDVFLSAWVKVVDEYGHQILDIRLPEADAIRKMMKIENFLYHPATSFSKSAWEKVGGYPEKNSYMAEDTAMWLRFFQAGFQLIMIPRCLVNYRIHYSNITSVNDARLSGAAAKELKALRQNREWRISLYLKQLQMRAARRELTQLFKMRRGFNAKNFHYYLLTYFPASVVRFFMWQVRPRLRFLLKAIYGRRVRI